MTRAIMPIILVVAAIGLFVLYTNPAYNRIQSLQAQSSSFNDALNKAQELRAQREKLQSKRNTFSTDNVQKLQRMLPDNVDNIRLVIDITNIAARHKLILRNVELGSVSDSATQRSSLAVGSSGSAVGSVEVGFGLTSSYENLVEFLNDVEHSLRVIDVEKLDIDSKEAGTYNVTISIRTYWLH